jgi:hypothetical protein
LVSSFLHLNLSPDAKRFPEALFKTIYIFVGKEAKSDLEVTAEAEAKASRSKGEDRRRLADCCLSRIQGKAGEEKWQLLKWMQRQREKKQDWPSKSKQREKAEEASLISVEAKAKSKAAEESRLAAVGKARSTF